MPESVGGWNVVSAQPTVFSSCTTVMSQFPFYEKPSSICRCVSRDYSPGSKSRQALAMELSNRIFQCVKKIGQLDPFAPETKSQYRSRCINSVKSQGRSPSLSRKLCNCMVRVQDDAYEEIMNQMQNFNDWGRFEVWRNSTLQRYIKIWWKA